MPCRWLLVQVLRRHLQLQRRLWVQVELSCLKMFQGVVDEPPGNGFDVDGIELRKDRQVIVSH